MHRDSFPGKKRYCGLAGSSDALALSRLAVESRPLAGEHRTGAVLEHRAIAVLTANALDASRLLEEIAWFAPQLRSCLLPDWETLPYDSFSPHHDLVSERLATLYRIQRGDFDVVAVPVATALVRMCPPAYLASYTFFLRQGDRLDADALRRQLALAGYSAVTQVMSPGEFCFRGGIVDLYPMGAAVPYRLDLDDDVVETIRTFDVDTQRTLYAVKDVRLLPAREFPLDEAGRNKFRGRWRELFEGDPSKRRLYKDISNGVPAAGVEYYLPLFFDALATVFDYLPEASSLVLHRDVAGAIQAFWRDAQSRYTMMGGDPDRPLLPPAQLFVSAEEFFTRAKAYPRIDIRDAPEEEPAPPAQENLPQPIRTDALPPLAVDRRAKDPLAALKGFIAGSGLRILLSAESPGRRETMLSYLSEHGLAPSSCKNFEDFFPNGKPLSITVSSVSNGFSVTAEGWAIVTEAELYAGTVRRKGRGAKTQTSVEGMLRDLSELKVGDPVVHAQHGIGRYGGLVNLDLGEGMTEFLLLAYDGGDKLYVPVSQLEVISRYSGAQPEEAPLHKLGSGQWDKARIRAARQVRDTAAELLDLYAKRASRQGHPFNVSQRDLDAFADGFGFEETVDQAATIAAVGADMISGKPMDRLICGDVGFGKTEVALRAAFIAVADQKQVALLCPTTLLVEQHFQTFADRFADWPVKIGELSRFNTGKQTTEVLQKISSGELDIVIGTHKLLSRDVKFERLGLVIIDEEHRFGVHQKEALKRLRAEVDVLTLTATPIPRTLALSLEGLRDFSVIATAPERRLAIKTFVAPHSEGLIREAVLRELRRGGQVYYLHNEVDTIEHAHDRLARLLPEARLAVAHGQMRERELERVTREFTQQRHNVLLCSTIIETGIDNPNANTIVIHRADRFGLAQLHQLRGRVGRSHHQAYAYLLVPPEEALGIQAKKRLEAIQTMEELGSGFYLAMHDLEIRGAGEVLGESQSGQIQEVGFDLYTRMLERAVRALKEGKAIDLDQPLSVATEIKLHVPALLPELYCNDVHERLTLYKRLANCATQEELDGLREELIDRFGLLPDPAKVLLESHMLRLLAAPLGVARVDATHEALQFQFQKESPVDRGKIIVLLQKRKNLRLAGPDRLRLEAKMAEWPLRVQAAKDLLGALAA
jgi:transcription-repair coupling factor (superfamily II helicase)